MRQTTLLTCALLIASWSNSTASLVLAQGSVTACQPPQPGEYLVLAVNQTNYSYEQLQRALPANSKMSVCQYLNDVVTRISGLRNVEDANKWARYVSEIVELRAFIVRPATAIPAQSLSTNNPQPLGIGYAVLVDSSNKPEIAEQLRQLTGSEVGLVSYGQRNYLLALQTTSQNAASSTLKQLSDRGFLAMLVDSRQVTLLKQNVRN